MSTFATKPAHPLSWLAAARLRSRALILAALTVPAVLGATGLAGWVFHIPALVQLVPNLAVMQANTAALFLLFALGGVAALAGWNRSTAILGGTVVAAAGMTLASHVTELQSRLDTLLLHPFMGDGISPPGRMSAPTSLGFTMVGVALMVPAAFPRVPALRQVTHVLALLILLLGGAGCVSMISNLYTGNPLPILAGMSILTIAAFLATGVALEGLSRRSLTAALPDSLPPLGIPVAVVGVVAVLFLALVVAANRNSTLEDQSEIGVQRLSVSLQERIDPRIRALRRMGMRWEAARGSPRAQWEIDARAYLQDQAGAQSIAWIPPTGQGGWRVEKPPAPGGGPAPVTGGPAREELELAQVTRSARIVLAPAAAGRIPGYHLIVPLWVGGPFGWLVQTYEFDETFESVATRDHPGSWVAIEYGGRTLFQTRQAQTAYQARFTRNARVRLLNVDWTVNRALPDAELKQGLLGPSTLTVLVGLPLVLLLALCTGLAQRAYGLRNKAAAALRNLEDQIQARQRSEQQLDLFVDGAKSQAIVMLDPDGLIVRWNAGAERLKGYSAQEILGRPFSVFYSPEDLAAGLPQQVLAAAREEGRCEAEGWRVRKDGSRFWANVVVSTLRDQDGTIRGFGKITRDFTERMHAEQKIKDIAAELAARAAQLQAVNEELQEAKVSAEAARAAAEEANVSKSAFLANMSHELRTPLNAVLGFSELILEELKDPQGEDVAGDVAKIYEAGAHLLGLINDILDLSKIEAGKMNVVVEEFDIAAVVQQVANTARPLMAKKANQLEVQCAAGLGAMRSDVTRIRQILLNLLSNAAKFTKDGRVTLRAELSGAGPEAHVHISVQDTGIGIKPEDLSKLFQPFSQVDATTTRRFGGTGLGLSLVKMFAATLGGRTDVESEFGQGTTFHVYLPLSKFAEAHPVVVVPPVTRQRNALPVPVAPAGERPKALIIDDDASARRFIAAQLAHAGYHVDEAANGADGVRMAQSLQPHVITLDIMMPGLDGWAVISKLRANPATAEIPVIVISILDEEVRAFQLGAAEYFTKPLDASRFHNTLRGIATRTGRALLIEGDATTRMLMNRLLVDDGWAVSDAPGISEARAALESVAIDLIILGIPARYSTAVHFISDLKADPRWADLPVVAIAPDSLDDEDRASLSRQGADVLEQRNWSVDQLLTQARQQFQRRT